MNEAHVRLTGFPPLLVLVGSCIPPALELELKPRKLFRKLLSAEFDIRFFPLKWKLYATRATKFPFFNLSKKCWHLPPSPYPVIFHLIHIHTHWITSVPCEMPSKDYCLFCTVNGAGGCNTSQKESTTMLCAWLCSHRSPSFGIQFLRDLGQPGWRWVASCL